MPHRVTEFQPTPNPNALKCTVTPRIPDPPRSFRSPEDAASDPLAAALFGVEGVCGLLINGDWITVNKRAEVEWTSIKQGVQEVLARF